MFRRWTKCFVVVGLMCCLGAVLASCASTPSTSPGDEDRRDEATPLEEAGDGEIGSNAGFYFKDETDGGDDPLKAGCHWRYSDPQCREDRKFHNGDGCYNRIDLWEWTDPECHGPRQDIMRYDCHRECQRRGFQTGVCVTVPNACGDGMSSAQCECISG